MLSPKDLLSHSISVLNKYQLVLLLDNLPLSACSTRDWQSMMTYYGVVSPLFTLCTTVYVPIRVSENYSYTVEYS